METEPKQPHDTCMHCDKDFNLTKANTYFFKYDDMPQAVHLSCLCPHCAGINTMFLGDEDTAKHYEQFGFGVHTQPVPNFEVMKMYLELYEVPIIEEHELIPRQEKAAQFLAHILDIGQLSPEDFNGKGELYI